MKAGQTRQSRASLFLTASGGGAQRAFSGLLILLVVAAATRGYGARAAGILGIATTLALVGTALADFGTTPLSLREFARRPPTRSDYLSLMRAKIVLAFVVAAVTAMGAMLAGADLAAATAISVSSLPLTAITTTATSLLVVQSRGLPLAFAASAGLVVGAGAVFVALAVHGPAYSLALSLPVARLTEAIVLARATPPKADRIETTAFTPRAIGRAWPLAAQGVLQMLYQRSTILVAGWVLGTVGAGIVAQGFSMLAALMLIPSVLATAAFPRLVVAAREDAAAALRSMRTYAGLGLLAVSPFAILLLAWPGTVLSALYGDAAPGLVAFVRWGVLALLLVCPNSLISYLFITFGRERLLVGVSVLTSIGSTLLVFLGARVAGIAGVGWSLFASEVLTTLCFGVAWFRARSPVAVPITHG